MHQKKIRFMGRIRYIRVEGRFKLLFWVLQLHFCVCEHVLKIKISLVYFFYARTVIDLCSTSQHDLGTSYSRSIPFKSQYWTAQKFIKKDIHATHRVRKGNQTLEVKCANFTEPKLFEAISTTTVLSNPDEVDMNNVHYQVTVTTAKSYDSSMSDINAGILLALIGEEGKCFLYRLSPLAIVEGEILLNWRNHNSEIHTATHRRFQSGSSDVFMTSGPNLGKLQAVWIGPERGTWRMDKLSITVVPEHGVNKDCFDVEKENNGGIVQYDFENFNALIGDGGVVPAAELKASQASHLSYSEYLELLSRKKVSIDDVAIARAKGMKEYQVLKLSLLSYDAFLVTLGTAVSAITGHSEIARGFFAGGISGFMYLFVLQQAVDRIPAPSNTDNLHEASNEIERSSNTLSREEESQFSGAFAGFSTPLMRIAALVLFSGIMGKVLFPDNEQIITKEILFAGAAGFLMSKVSTVLASSKPLPAE